ncbi:MAG TPA: HEAT repeat domain-containing protein, partial [Isosphaeraceae bacterium]|nr:HEAT repeat domain-containing protein [Isosphaeraceae bacterium]
MTRFPIGWLAIPLLVACSSFAQAQESAMVRLLKGGKVPDERQGTIVEMIGKRGSAADLTYLYERVLDPSGFTPENRLTALNALAEAALTRKTKPEGDLSKLASLLKASDGLKTSEKVRLAAIRLAGLWQVETVAPALSAIASDEDSSASLRGAALDALASLGGKAALDAIRPLTSADRPWNVRAQAVAALARIDLDAALASAVSVILDARGNADLTGLLEPFLTKQGGADKLAKALESSKSGVPKDAARLALRAMYAQGHTEPSLVATFSKAAGLDAEVKPLTQPQMDAFIADVLQKGDPERGEAVFRRVDLACANCHAVAGAGGGIGPELSALGSSSPPDYIITSILTPDQAIKEEYQTMVVLTDEGQVFQGIVVDKDDNRLILKEATGETRTIPTESIEDSREGGSLMPKGLPNMMTRAEMVDLVRFLSELGKPGPYGVRSSPIFQRFLTLRDVPSGTDATTLPDASADQWRPIYARVSGDLPLDEVETIAGGPIAYLQGSIQITNPGRVEFRVDHPEGVSA